MLCSNTKKYIDNYNSVNLEIFRDVLDIKLYQYRYINIIDKSEIPLILATGTADSQHLKGCLQYKLEVFSF